MLKQVLKSYVKGLGLYPAYEKLRDNIQLFRWEKAGRPVPPPHPAKKKIISEYVKRYGPAIMVETGTYMGDMVQALRRKFKKVYSIEINSYLYNAALERFKKYLNVNIRQGDSGIILPQVLAEINEPALFWLDGHYSGEGTGRGSADSPVMRELAFILNHPVKNHVILIDDARLCDGTNGYPTIEQLKQFLASFNPNPEMEIKEDIIRIVRK